jgi:hypothetical protein
MSTYIYQLSDTKMPIKGIFHIFLTLTQTRTQTAIKVRDIRGVQAGECFLGTRLVLDDNVQSMESCNVLYIDGAC